MGSHCLLEAIHMAKQLVAGESGSVAAATNTYHFQVSPDKFLFFVGIWSRGIQYVGMQVIYTDTNQELTAAQPVRIYNYMQSRWDINKQQQGEGVGGKTKDSANGSLCNIDNQSQSSQHNKYPCQSLRPHTTIFIASTTAGATPGAGGARFGRGLGLPNGLGRDDSGFASNVEYWTRGHGKYSRDRSGWTTVRGRYCGLEQEKDVISYLLSG